MTRRKSTPTTLRNLTDLGRAAERTATAGWHDLTNAVDDAAGRTQHLAEGTRSRIRVLRGDVRKQSDQARKRGAAVRKRGLAARDEAYRRGTAARDALSGRRTHPWRWAAAAAAAGLAAGAAVIELGRRLIQSREQAQLEKIEQTVADVTGDTANASRMTGWATVPGDGAAGTSATSGPRGGTNATSTGSD
ncbi:MAG TPA: hypothetical protein VFR11_15430 [Micromonosporaceae bacterium]|nr:hypothetical protein [Micromonosporaceae bacterium]